MAKKRDIDLRAAINAVSDVVQNRPRPLRLFDQIYMKAGDMVLQSELVAWWANGKRLAFIGDGDAIGVCVAYLHKCGILDYGPSEIVVFDFDERICGALARFAANEQLGQLKAKLYNCLDPFPGPTQFDCFYTNPPWGKTNGGESVKVFVQRGMEAISYVGEGMVVIADDDVLEWPKRVLANVQEFVIGSGFFVQKMNRQLHEYHLDNAPDLRSCNIIIKALPSNKPPGPSLRISDPSRLAHFYGEKKPPTVKYVREQKRLDYGKAHDDEYSLERLE
jgi:N4-bis(aminopropyl)spermidine synthase